MRKVLGALPLVMLFAACGDREVPTEAAAKFSTADGGVFGTRSNSLRDNGILLEDSHFSARMSTVTTYERPRVADPRSLRGQNPFAVAPTLATLQVPDVTLVEAGFGSDGQLRFNMYWDASANLSEISSLRTVGNIVTSYDRFGFAFETSVFNTLMQRLGLPGGSLLDALLPPGGNGSGGGACFQDPQSCGPAPQRADEQRTVQLSGDGRERRETTQTGQISSALSGNQPASETVRVFRRGPMRAVTSADTLFRLIEITATDRARTPLGIATTRSHTTIEYTNFRVNEASDAARVARQARSAPAEISRLALLPAVAQNSEAAASLLGANSELNTSASSLFGVCGDKGGDHSAPVGATGAVMVWQYGICSGADTWDGLRPWISSQFVVKRELAIGTAPLATMSSEGSELSGSLGARGGPGTVLLRGIDL